MSSVTNDALIAAQVHLADLQRRHQQNEIAQAKQRLGAIRKERREAIAEHERLATVIRAERASQSKLRVLIEDAAARVAASLRIRPAAADYLAPTDDPEIAEWTEAHAALEAEHAKLRQEFANLTYTDPMLCIRLQTRIEQLSHQERATMLEIDNVARGR